ncbi:PAS domain S-box protein [Sulfitobacter sp. HNIBRBA3233]|uniref:PAS domain-containing sensor histidine kinase n=1 Tax=Sulfitobacter marinivivus TaxID=3158558 RepID=UPI0032DFE907
MNDHTLWAEQFEAGTMFQAMVENCPFGVWVIDSNGWVAFCNRGAEKLLSQGSVKSIGGCISDHLPNFSFSDGKLSYSGVEIGEFQNIILLPSSEELRYGEVSLSGFEDAGGQQFTIVTVHDVTSQIKAWYALRDQSERWNLALEGSQIGVFESDLRTGSGRASDVWYQLLGIIDTDDKDSDREWRERIHPDDREKVEALDAECIAGRVERSEAKFRMRVGDDDWRWMRSILRVTEQDEQGNPVRVLGTMIDITPLETALEIAESRRAGLEMLVENAPVAMAVLSIDGSFMLHNDACDEIFGYTPGQLEQKNAWQLSGEETLGNLRGEFERLLASSVSISKIEEKYTRPNGENIDISIRVSIYRRKTRSESRLIVQMVDITEAKRLEALKNDFVATVSHELRTPLASVHGALRLLSELINKNGSEQIAKLLNVANRNSQRLTHVVNDLLDFQKLTSGHFSVELTDVDAVEIVRQTVFDSETFAEQFDVSLIVDAPNFPVLIHADAQRVQQVITNLLSNASKFATRGTKVEIKASIDDGAFVFSVTNSGRGISPKFGKRLFEPFSQQAEHLTRDRDGTGLGLAICKQLVEMMGGEIGYASELDVQTTFWVRFPIISFGER